MTCSCPHFEGGQRVARLTAQCRSRQRVEGAFPTRRCCVSKLSAEPGMSDRKLSDNRNETAAPGADAPEKESDT